MLGKQEYFCHQGRNYNKGKKDKYIEKNNVALKQDHAFIKSRKQLNQQKNWAVQWSSALKLFTGLHLTRLVLIPKIIKKKLIKI